MTPEKEKFKELEDRYYLVLVDAAQHCDGKRFERELENFEREARANEREKVLNEAIKICGDNRRDLDLRNAKGDNETIPYIRIEALRRLTKLRDSKEPNSENE